MKSFSTQAKENNDPFQSSLRSSLILQYNCSSLNPNVRISLSLKQIKLMAESVMARRLTIKRPAKRAKEEKQQSKDNNLSVREIQFKFVGMNHHANPPFICHCEICQTSSSGFGHPLSRQALTKIKEATTLMLSKKSNMKDLLTYLAPTKKRQGLRVQIPEICFYKDGEPESIFMTAKEEIKCVRPQKLSQRQVLHTFLEQKRLYKQALREKYESSIMSHIDFEEVHEKYLKAILPPFKAGGSDIHEGFKSFRIHKDSKLMMDSLVQHQTKDTDEVCLIKRLDGSFQLMNQLQFVNLMRNRGGTTSDIELIQSFIRPKKLAESLIYSEYESWELIKNKPLYERASHEIEIILEIIPNISPLYISREASEEFELALRENSADYALYQTYKIIHYLHKAADIQTQHLKLGWLVNDIDLFYLYAVPEFQYEIINFEGDPKLTRLEFQKAKHEIKQMDGVQNYLIEKWEEMKKQKDIDTERLAAKPSNRSDQVFAILHPGINFERLMKSKHFESKVHSIVETRAVRSASKPLHSTQESPTRSPRKSAFAQTKTSGRLWITSPSP